MVSLNSVVSLYPNDVINVWWLLSILSSVAAVADCISRFFVAAVISATCCSVDFARKNDSIFQCVMRWLQSNRYRRIDMEINNNDSRLCIRDSKWWSTWAHYFTFNLWCFFLRFHFNFDNREMSVSFWHFMVGRLGWDGCVPFNLRNGRTVEMPQLEFEFGMEIE